MILETEPTYGEGKVAKGALQLVRQTDARRPGAYADDPHVPLVKDGIFPGGIHAGKKQGTGNKRDAAAAAAAEH